MDHSWRPIQQQAHPNNICPTCSYVHFPFCPPYPPPLPLPPPPPPPPPPQLLPDYLRPYGYTPPVDNGYYHNNDYSNTDGDGNRSFKRPRVDAFGNQINRLPHWNGYDHDRRIKLIRDHGADVSPPLIDRTLTRNHNHYSHDVSSNMYSPFHPNNETPPPPPLYSHHQHQPPLPPTPPPPPPPMEPPPPPPSSSPPPSLFPVPIGSNLSNTYLNNNEEWRPTGQVVATKQQLSPDKLMVVDATCLFEQPYRATRPDHVVVILRGLPGSGKSYLAKRIRDLEVENGGVAPRIHSMDDYFMTEVEKVDETDGGKSKARGKKAVVKRVMEYCYEPEMEEVYRESMLKAFKKTLEEGNFNFVIVDDRNLRVADFAQFWAIAKRSGYEAYLLEAAYKDPAGCAARNIHGFTRDEVERMAGQWEEAPILYLRLDIKSLFRGDDLKESGIQEVDMDAEDEELGKDTSGLSERMPEMTSTHPAEDDDSLAMSKDEKRWDADGRPLEEVKELGKSKWSEDLDEDDTEGSEGARSNVNALSGLIQAYGKKQKSVHWSDQVGNRGFSISAAKRANIASLVIGPGSGYNLKSNPLPEEESPGSALSTGKLKKKKSVFQEQLRAERESFKLVFDRRRQRIGYLDLEEDS